MATATASAVSYNITSARSAGVSESSSLRSAELPENSVLVPVGVPLTVTATRTKTKSSGWFPFKRQKQRREKILASSPEQKQQHKNGAEVIIGYSSPEEAVGSKNEPSNLSHTSANRPAPFPTERHQQANPAAVVVDTKTNGGCVVTSNQNYDPNSVHRDTLITHSATHKFPNGNYQYQPHPTEKVELNGQVDLNHGSVASSIDCYVINSERRPPPKFQAVPPPPSEVQHYGTLDGHSTSDGKTHSLKKAAAHKDPPAEVNENKAGKFNTLPIVPQPSHPAPPPPPPKNTSPNAEPPAQSSHLTHQHTVQSDNFRYLKNIREEKLQPNGTSSNGPRKNSNDTKPAFLKVAEKEKKENKSLKKDAKKHKKEPPQPAPKPFLMEIEKLEKATAKTAERANLEFQALEEELLAVGDEPPMVARSTVRGAAIDTDRHRLSRQRQHCLFGQEVYDQMLKNSLSACEDLQHNLDDYIVEVRSSPVREVQKNPNENGPSVARPVSSPTAPDFIPTTSLNNGEGTYYSVDEDPGNDLASREQPNKQQEKMGTLKKTIEANGETEEEKKRKRKVFRLKLH